MQTTILNDGGAAQLADMHSLVRLNLGTTNISDRSIDVLSGLKQLEYLNLADTDVTASGIARLEQALPDTLAVNDKTMPTVC